MPSRSTMAHETVEFIDDGPAAIPQRKAAMPSDVLQARVLHLERSNEELRQRLRRFEEERALIKARIRTLLQRLGAAR